MKIDDLLMKIDDLLEEAWNVPLMGGKRVVDVDKVRDLIDDIRLNLPSELKQAKAIVSDRSEIIAIANREANDILKRANDRAQTLVSQEEVFKAAQKRAEDAISAAKQQSREIRKKANDYAEEHLKTAEEVMIKSASEVRAARQTLRK